MTKYSKKQCEVKNTAFQNRKKPHIFFLHKDRKNEYGVFACPSPHKNTAAYVYAGEFNVQRWKKISSGV